MTIYYVDTAAADDTGAGTSEATAWKTLAKVNSSSFNPGDSVLLKTDCIFNEQHLIAPSSGSPGSPITFGAYGSGNKPLINSAHLFAAGDWIKTAGKTNVYQAAFSAAGEIDAIWLVSPFGSVFQNTNYFLKKASINEVDAAQSSCFYDAAADVLYIHTSDSSSPITNGKDYRLPIYLSAVSTFGKDYVNIENIDFQCALLQGLSTFDYAASPYVGSSNISITNVNGAVTSHNVFAIIGQHITLNNCSTIWADGNTGAFTIADLGAGQDVHTIDITLNDCTAGLTTVGASGAVVLEAEADIDGIEINNLSITGNYSYAITTGNYAGSLDNVVIYGVSISGDITNDGVLCNVGSDWEVKGVQCIGGGSIGGYAIRVEAVETARIHKNIISSSANGVGVGASTGITIDTNIILAGGIGVNLANGTGHKAHNNACIGQTVCCVAAGAGPSGDATSEIKNNVFVNSANGTFILAASIKVDYNCGYNLTAWGSNLDLVTYRGIGLDTHSINLDPKFRSTTDFHLQSTSPCIGNGTDIGLTTDFDGRTVPNPVIGTPSIGAYEFYSGGGGGGTMGFSLGLGLGSGGGAITSGFGKYRVFREFTETLAVGAVNGSAESGQTVTVVDTEGKISQADGKLVVSGGKAVPAYGDPGLWLDEVVTRAPGVIGAAKITLGDVTQGFEFGFDTGKSGALGGDAFRVVSDTVAPYDNGTAGPVVAIPTDSAVVTKIVNLRAAGAHFFRRIGTGNWRYLYSTSTNNTATLYLSFAGYNQSLLPDWAHSPRALWMPTYYLSDGFTAANGTSNTSRTSDGLGHAEGIAGGIGSGGVAVWDGGETSGAIQSNRLVITPTLGSELLNDGGFETWGTSTNATHWAETTAGETISQESTVIHSGASALKIAYDASPAAAYVASIAGSAFNILGAGTWYKASVYAKKSGANAASTNFGEGSKSASADMGITNTLTTDYALFSRTGKKVGTNSFVIYSEIAPASQSVYHDDASVKQIVLASCFNTRVYATADVSMECSFQMITGTQIGFVFGLSADGTSFGLVYHNGAGKIKLDICIAGTWTNDKVNITTAYGSDQVFKFRRDGREIWSWYNSVLQGAGPSTTLSEAEDAALRGVKAGVFSTIGEPNSFNYFTCLPTGTNGEHNALGPIVGDY